MSGAERLLRRALEVARRGAGTTSPNPMVGALVVHGGEVIAEGYHRKAGEEHAEEVALARAAARSKGADLYVTLEPCAHQGRRPPCTQAILRSGVRRVFACIQDPNPLVNGKGFERLKQAGVEVSWGFLEEEARRLNEAYLKWIVCGRPFVILKAAVSLDGRIADAGGSSRWISGEEARSEVQRLRFETDAVLVGVGTALADNPALGVREPQPHKPLLKVVLDSNLRLPPSARLLEPSGGDQVLIYACAGADAGRAEALRAAGAQVVQVGAVAGRPSLAEVLDDLGRREVLHLLCEGGTETFTSFLAQGLADKVHLFVAPKILGADALPLAGALDRKLQCCIALETTEVRRIGPDVWIEAYLRGD
ncbi:MAG: bifunctional diaminohydroxyphosphoribosylaminopyrimidine deaminase/5-amino-6-(5-phosphoribosylamino)uracil reductase RibD [Acidobacteriota bacterium]